jgi:uncharacterized metal-binding protein
MAEEAKTTILYSCSGASNVGEMADRVARGIWAEGKVKRSCLAAIGAGLPSYLESAQASGNLVIDGCPVACGKKMFADKDISFQHVVLTEHGVDKGKTPIDEALLSRLTAEVKSSFGL